jgi:hypothetical protein
MAKLTYKERSNLPDSAFALPGRRFPINDPSHARDAKARASEALKKGWITKEEYDTINRKADKVLEDNVGTESFGVDLPKKASLWSQCVTSR